MNERFEFEKEVIERLTRIETKQDNICVDINEINNRLSSVEIKVQEHDGILKILSKGGKIWIQIFTSGIGVLIGAILVSIYNKGCY